MCGIFGFLKNKDCTCSVVEIIFQGLTDLESRGFDSVGCALFDSITKQSLIVRSTGLVVNLQDKYKKLKLSKKANYDYDYDYGFGHTRWSVIGKVTKSNAHPHISSPKGSFIVVHNGIIENYLELKEFLLSMDSSIIFHSETDTEVIGHLLEYLYYLNKQYQNDSIRLEDYVLQIIGKTMNLLVGTYGLIIHCSETPNILYAVKNGSSLVIGMNSGKGYFISSDLPTLRANYASQVIALEDQQIAVVYSDHHEMHKIIFNQDSHLNTTLLETYSFRIPNLPFEDYQLANNTKKKTNLKFEHHMLKEIHEQKQVIKNTTSGRITIEKDIAIIKLGSFNDVNSKIIKLFLEEPKVQFLFLACGTSLHAGLFGKYLMEDFLGIPCSVECASEFLSKTNLIYKNTIVIALSQSGETADTLAAVKLAKSFQIETFGICNVVGSTLSRMVSEGIYTHAGIEQAVASTKAFIAQLCVLYILACYLKEHRRSEHLLNQSYYCIQNKNNINMNEFLIFIKIKLPSLASTVLKQNQDIIQLIVSKYAHTMKAILFMGKSYFYPIALECALKIKETSYIHSEAYPAGEMKHGPIALIDSNVLVVFFIPDDFQSASKMIHSVQEIKSRNGIIIIVISKLNLSQKESQIKLLADYIIEIPNVPNDLSNYLLPILSVIPFQLFSYYLAIEKGLNVDRPRNLAKSVTVF